MWKRVPRNRDWKLFCERILACTDIEFVDGVILGASFNSVKFRMLMAKILSEAVHNAAIRIQLAWLCYKAHQRVKKLRNQIKKKRDKLRPMHNSGFVADFPFNAAAETSSFRNLKHEEVDDVSTTTDMSDVTPATHHRFPKNNYSHLKPRSTGTENGSVEGLPFLGSSLEANTTAQELADIRDHLNSVLSHIQQPSSSQNVPSSIYFPNASVRSVMSTVVSEEIADEVQSLHQAVNFQRTVCEGLMKEVEQLKASPSITSVGNLDASSVQSMFREEKEELKNEILQLRQAHESYAARNDNTLVGVVKAIENTSRLAEAVNEVTARDKNEKDVKGGTHDDTNARTGGGYGVEYEDLREKMKRDKLEKEMDIAYLRNAVDKLTRALKQSKGQYEDLEIETKRQNEKLMKELLSQKQEYEVLQKKLLPMGRSSEKLSVTSVPKPNLQTLKAQNDNIFQDSQFQRGLDHIASKGKIDVVGKLENQKHVANRRIIYSSLENIKFQNLMRSIGVTTIDEQQYGEASHKDRLMTIRQLQQVKRVHRFLNSRALRWRLQTTDPNYKELAKSFIDILSTQKSTSTLSEALRLGVRLRHEELTVIVLNQLHIFLTQAYERNKKYFAPTLYTLLGDASHLAQVMRIFFSSSRVQHEGLQIVVCIITSSRSDQDLENNLSPSTSRLFEAAIRILFWHKDSTNLCMNALTIAKKMVTKCPAAKEAFCTTKQVKVLMGYATIATQSLDLFESFISFICTLTLESLPLVQRLSDGGLSSKLSDCLMLKCDDVAFVSVVAKAVLSLFSYHGPIFIQEMFGNKNFFHALIHCLSMYSSEPKVFKLVDMCFLAICGQNKRIISRLPEKSMSQLMLKILKDKNLNAMVVLPTLMTIITACMSNEVLKEFHASGLHSIIQQVLLHSKVPEIQEHAAKAYRLIADVDPEARKAEEEKAEKLRIEKKIAEEKRLAEIKVERETAGALVKEFEEKANRFDTILDDTTKTGNSITSTEQIDFDSVISARQESERILELERAKALEQKRREENVKELNNLRRRMEESERKTEEIVREQEAENAERAVAMQRATEVVVLDFIDDEIKKVVLKECKREEARLEKIKHDKMEMDRISQLKARIDAAERSAMLALEMERKELISQEKLRKEEVEREAQIKAKQEHADRIVEKLFNEELNRRTKSSSSDLAETTRDVKQDSTPSASLDGKHECVGNTLPLHDDNDGNVEREFLIGNQMNDAVVQSDAAQRDDETNERVGCDISSGDVENSIEQGISEAKQIVIQTQQNAVDHKKVEPVPPTQGVEKEMAIVDNVITTGDKAEPDLPKHENDNEDSTTRTKEKGKFRRVRIDNEGELSPRKVKHSHNSLQNISDKEAEFLQKVKEMKEARKIARRKLRKEAEASRRAQELSKDHNEKDEKAVIE